MRMKNFWRQSAIFIFAFAPLLAEAGGDEVVVVYNSRVPESKAVAEYYAKARQVPAKQIFGFAMTTNEEMSRAEFRDTLQSPLAKRLEADKLWRMANFTNPANGDQPKSIVRRVASSKIRYAVLCYGVPLKIAHDPSVSNSGRDDKFFPARDDASVDSELAWLPIAEANFPLTGPLRNWAYGATNSAWLSPSNGILLTARLDGPSADIARGLVDKAIAAETNGLWGRAYFDARGFERSETNYYVGDEWILGAAEIAHQVGYETVVDNKPAVFAKDFPMSQIAIYAGWYAENVSGPFELPKVEFMPGAFAYHLHSYSAFTIRVTDHDWVGPFLAKGVTCTMGCVNEPYLMLTPNVAMFMMRFTVGQLSFGEAAWTAQPALSWQTTVVGDPLYRPFAKLPQTLHTELTQQHSPFAQWSWLRVVNLEELRGTRAPQLAQNLENLPDTTNSAVLTEKLAGYYEQLGKPSSAIATLQLALERDPSPEQRIRIRLALADKLLAQKNQKEAYADLWKIIDENPDYPAKFNIMKRLLDLAVARGEKDEITRCVTAMQKYAPTDSK
jgi:uncharacterized protein (TIGR03790 family)